MYVRLMPQGGDFYQRHCSIQSNRKRRDLSLDSGFYPSNNCYLSRQVSVGLVLNSISQTGSGMTSEIAAFRTSGGIIWGERTNGLADSKKFISAPNETIPGWRTPAKDWWISFSVLMRKEMAHARTRYSDKRELAEAG